MVVVCSDHGPISTSLIHHVRQRKAGQMVLHVVSNVGPHCEENALSLVIAGSILVRLTKIARHNGPVDGRYDLSEGDLVHRTSEDVSSANTTLRADQSGSLERQQDLLEIRLG